MLSMQNSKEMHLQSH